MDAQSYDFFGRRRNLNAHEMGCCFGENIHTHLMWYPKHIREQITIHFAPIIQTYFDMGLTKVILS